MNPPTQLIHPASGLLGILGFAIVVAAFIAWVVLTARRNKAWRREITLRGEQIAVIDERVEFTTGGGFAVLMLIVFSAVAVLAYYWSTTAMQQTVACFIWIGFNVLWGTAAIIGRRRTYTVYRAAQPPPRVKPKG